MIGIGAQSRVSLPSTARTEFDYATMDRPTWPFTVCNHNTPWHGLQGSHGRVRWAWVGLVGRGTDTVKGVGDVLIIEREGVGVVAQGGGRVAIALPAALRILPSPTR